MSKEEILCEMDRLETRIFLINMTERLTWEDKANLQKCEARLAELKQMINAR